MSVIFPVIWVGSFCVMGILAVFSLMPEWIISIFDKKGELCVSVLNEIYVRNLNHADNKVDELIL